MVNKRGQMAIERRWQGDLARPASNPKIGNSILSAYARKLKNAEQELWKARGSRLQDLRSCLQDSQEILQDLCTLGKITRLHRNLGRNLYEFPASISCRKDAILAEKTSFLQKRRHSCRKDVILADKTSFLQIRRHSCRKDVILAEKT